MATSTLERPPGARDDADEREDEDVDKDGITEFEKLAPDRMDAVSHPASGFPPLIMKALSAPNAPETGGDGVTATTDTETQPSSATETPTWEDYRKAVAAYKATEPGVGDALDGTEFLKARAEWGRWNTAGHEAGLDGTHTGYARWTQSQSAETVEKRDFDPKVGGGVDRDKIPASDFVDPAGRRFPIVTQADVSDAVHSYGRAKPQIPFARFKSRVTSIARRKGFSLPEKWETATAKEVLEDALAKAVGDGDLEAAEAAEVIKAQEALEAGWAAKDDPDASEDTEDGDIDADDGGDEDGDDDSDDAVKAAQGGKVACSKCMAKVAARHAFCPSCGTRMGASKEAGETPDGAEGEGAAAKAVEEARATIAASVDYGLITKEAGDALLAEVEKAKRMLPADTQPAGEHREPDGTSTVEPFEHDAGMATDPDSSKDKVPASVAAMGKSVPYTVARMHDATCAAFRGEDVIAEYPTLKSITDAVDVSWFTKGAQDAIGEGDTAGATGWLEVANAAKSLLGADAAAVADGRAYLAKSFTDMYPNAHLKPSDPRQPGSFQRPYLSSGHSANRPVSTPDIPPSSHVPEPEGFHRGYMTSGRAAMSPGDHGPNNPNPPDAGGRSYYSTSEKDMAAAAMRSIHDHIASTFMGCCPMAPTTTQMPPDMGARGVPTAHIPDNMGGISTVKASDGDAPFGGHQAPPFGDGGKRKKRKKDDGMTKEELTEALAAAARAGAEAALSAVKGTLPDAAALTTAAAGPAEAMAARYDTELADLRKKVEELGAEPDPAMAPVRGQMARSPLGEAAPVEKRSLADEELERRQAGQRAERAAYLGYLEAQSQHATAPGRALAAEQLLEKEMAGS